MIGPQCNHLYSGAAKTPTLGLKQLDSKYFKTVMMLFEFTKPMGIIMRYYSSTPGKKRVIEGYTKTSAVKRFFSLKNFFLKSRIMTLKRKWQKSIHGKMAKFILN